MPHCPDKAAGGLAIGADEDEDADEHDNEGGKSNRPGGLIREGGGQE